MSLVKTLGLLVFTGLLASCAPTLAGQLRGESGEPITTKDARVNVAPLSGHEHALVLEVDETGHFTSDEDLTPGTYLVEALVPGYAVCSEKIELGKSQTVDLKLKPLAALKPGVIGTGTAGAAARGAGSATLTPPSF